MIIRKADINDIDSLMVLYKNAKVFMANSGNPHQWADAYPEYSTIEADIEHGVFYVADDNGVIAAGFAMITGEDPTYAIIENGEWLDDSPYATVHRLVGDGKHPGIGKMCLNWCFTQHRNIRVDTHHDNKIMQRILQELNFKECGIIYTRNHSPRIAYQRNDNQ